MKIDRILVRGFLSHTHTDFVLNGSRIFLQCVPLDNAQISRLGTFVVVLNPPIR